MCCVANSKGKIRSFWGNFGLRVFGHTFFVRKPFELGTVKNDKRGGAKAAILLAASAGKSMFFLVLGRGNSAVSTEKQGPEGARYAPLRGTVHVFRVPLDFFL